MTVSADYVAYVTDQLSQSVKVTSRRMFGGVGLYCQDLFFGLIAADAFYLKVDDSNRPDYVSRGCAAFQPVARDQNIYSLSYFAVPPEVLEDADELAVWARKSIGVAVLSAAAKTRVAAAKAGRKKPLKTATAKPRRVR
jgi:DNA transformation protein and related proteins